MSPPTAEQTAPDASAAEGHAAGRVIPARYVGSFALVTVLFALWGFANDITNPMVAAFKGVLELSYFESSLVQAAFYGGYCVMAIPAALFIRRFSYRAGILLGLALFAGGCLLFLPATKLAAFAPFLLAYFVMTSGLAFLETTANPYILAMGDAETAPRRLNFAQAFNPVGSLCGMFVARNFVLTRLDGRGAEERATLFENDPAAFDALRDAELATIAGPYLVMGVFLVAVLVAFFFARLPEGETHRTDGAEGGGSALDSLKRLLGNGRYVGGVVAQAFYVGAQIMCWTFIIQYAENELGMSAADAQLYNIAAMVMFVCGRAICTYLLKFVEPSLLLGLFAVGGGAAIAGTVTLTGMAGLYSLMSVSIFMSLMFPTIYGIALAGLGDDAKIGSAGLICAIGGGCVMPPLQASIMDGPAREFAGAAFSATRASFVLPLLCFVVVAVYAFAIFVTRPRAAEAASS